MGSVENSADMTQEKESKEVASFIQMEDDYAAHLYHPLPVLYSTTTINQTLLC